MYVDPIDKKFRRSTGELAPGYADLVIYTTTSFFTTLTHTNTN